VFVVRHLEVSQVEPPLLTSVIPSLAVAPSPGQKQNVKIQYVDGTSVLYRGSVHLSGDSLVGNGLRVPADSVGVPAVIHGSSTRDIAGIVIFRERTDDGASIGASLAATALTVAVLAAVAASIANGIQKSLGQALVCGMGGCARSINNAVVPSPGARAGAHPSLWSIPRPRPLP